MGGLERIEEYMMMELKHVIHLACEMITIFGALLLVVGAAIAHINLAICMINAATGSRFKVIAIKHGRAGITDGVASVDKVRKQLGETTALGLEVLVVSDVLETLLKPAEDYTFEQLGKLAAIATFRTVLAYFLSKEVKEISEELAEEFKQEKEEEEEIIASLKIPDGHIGGSLEIKKDN